jgi:hypothetical protein
LPPRIELCNPVETLCKIIKYLIIYRGLPSTQARNFKKPNQTTIEGGAGASDFLEPRETADDLFEVKDMLEAQPKSRSPQIGARPANAKKIMDDQQNLLLLDGQFSIIKGYGNDQRAKLFSVGNPHKQKGKDYYLYTVFVIILEPLPNL